MFITLQCSYHKMMPTITINTYAAYNETIITVNAQLFYISKIYTILSFYALSNDTILLLC